MECSSCHQIKELVSNKGICWKCHLSGINFNTRIEARLQGKKTK